MACTRCRRARTKCTTNLEAPFQPCMLCVRGGRADSCKYLPTPQDFRTQNSSHSPSSHLRSSSETSSSDSASSHTNSPVIPTTQSSGKYAQFNRPAGILRQHQHPSADSQEDSAHQSRQGGAYRSLASRPRYYQGSGGVAPVSRTYRDAHGVRTEPLFAGISTHNMTYQGRLEYHANASTFSKDRER